MAGRHANHRGKITAIKYAPLTLVSFATLMVSGYPAVAQQGSEIQAAELVEEIVVVGSRNFRPRSAADSPVPIDTISGDDFNNLANTADLTDNLRALVPSYTATPATGDGSAFVRPTSLRGLAPDHTLVLINGKRRHRSALVQLFAPAAGNGAHGPDIGMLPGIVLQRVEVLRDGASSQYGADAIAGVINFVTKRASEGGSAEARYGEFYEGEQSYQFASNIGLSISDTGYFNISTEYVENDGLSRGVQRPDAQALIDAGVQGVGADAPYGDEPLVQSWGRPQTDAFRLFGSAGFDLSDDAEVYLFGNYADADGRYRFFYRPPTHPTIRTLNALGFTGLLGGYTPFLEGAQTDYSVVGGVSGTLGPNVYYDVSVGVGSNELDYFLNNTLNPSLGLTNGQPAQRDFDVGALKQEEANLNADFSMPISGQVNLAFGAEWREEKFTVIPGEPNSFLGEGSNGFGGYKPQDSGTFKRDNYALYTDVEFDVTPDWLLQGALRYEDFSDFGGTLNWKLATRYSVTGTLNLRGAVSTGFHAPTPGQSNFRTTITTFDGVTGLQTLEGLVPPASDLAIAVGGAPLKEEESTNYSIGLTMDIGYALNLTADFFRVEVDDRIYRTGDIAHPTLAGSTISFYTNALDIVSEGIDVVVTSDIEWSRDVMTVASLAANYNDISVTGQRSVGGIQPVADSIVEDIENNYPNFRFVLSTNTTFANNWNFMARANFYGSHFDERGTIKAAVNPTAKIGSTIYFDVELAYQVKEGLTIAAGAVNVLDSFIDEIGSPNANRLSVGLQYPRRSAANYEGGSWYLRVGYQF